MVDWALNTKLLTSKRTQLPKSQHLCHKSLHINLQQKTPVPRHQKQHLVSDCSCTVMNWVLTAGLTVPADSVAVARLLLAYPCHRLGAVSDNEGRYSNFRHLLCSGSESTSACCELCLFDIMSPWGEYRCHFYQCS